MKYHLILTLALGLALPTIALAKGDFGKLATPKVFDHRRGQAE